MWIVWISTASTEEDQHHCLFSPTKCLHCFPSDPNIRKEWINFQVGKGKVPDRISKNSVLCSIHFTVDLFTNKVQCGVVFFLRLKLRVLSHLVRLPGPNQRTSCIQRVFYNGCSRVLEKFMRISGVYVHTGIRRSKQLVLTEELFTDDVVNSE